MSHDNPPVDHALADEEDDTSSLERHLKSKPTWLRLFFMLVFWVLAGVTTFVASVVIVLGFFWVLFTGETNVQLKQAGKSIAAYIYQIISYLTYNSDEKPFPFGEWPPADQDD